MKTFAKSVALLICAAAVFLGGCLVAPPDPAAAERQRQEAETLAAAKKIAEAADSLAAAIAADPEAIPLYLRRGELLQALGRTTEARNVYKAGMKKAKRSDPLKAELAWRFALAEVLHLEDPGGGKRLLRHLPEGGALREDVLGVLALQKGDLRQALVHFDAALGKAPPQEVSAEVYYHASLAYKGLGDVRNTFGSLFHAVNNATHLGLVRDIETLWEILNAPPPSPSR